MTPTLSFHGAAGCVTGFCAELRSGEAMVLVDCGMFQGSKTLKALNYEDFPFEARRIDAVLLTHAHVDHSGLLPKLMRAGYSGPIYATAATRDLCAVMLADAGGIQEGEVKDLNRRNQRRGRPLVEPIYTARDAGRLMPQFRTVKFGQAVNVAGGVTATWWPAGHILGAGSIAVTIDAEDGPMSLLFSGDIGAPGSEFVAAPDAPSGFDHLVIESTYGDRERIALDPAARRRALAEELRAAHAAGGPLLIPAFAVERSQELLMDILAVMEAGDAPAGDVFLDSPLAIRATDVFLDRGWNPGVERNPFEPLRHSPHLRFLAKPAESDSLERLKGWHIIMAASGMCDAGRIRRHLKRLLWRRECTVMLTGYQAVGSLGRLLAEGAERVSIQGEEIRVRARVRMFDAYSAHADASGLVDWARARGPIKGATFIVHGEPEAAAGLKSRLAAAGFAAERLVVPAIDDRFALTRTDLQPDPQARRRLPSDAAGRLDWHNDRAALLLRLNAALEKAPDDKTRERLLRTLAEALGQAVDADQGAAVGVAPA